jgi:hypothetical protein
MKGRCLRTARRKNWQKGKLGTPCRQCFTDHIQHITIPRRHGINQRIDNRLIIDFNAAERGVLHCGAPY